MSNINDKKIREYRKHQLLSKWLIIILYLGVIVLEVLALYGKIHMLWGCGLFIIIYLLKKIL
jgi:fatty-acid desaturase